MDSRIIIRHLNLALKRLKLEVKDKREANFGFIKFYVDRILNKRFIEASFSELSRIHTYLNIPGYTNEFGLKHFYQQCPPVTMHNIPYHFLDFASAIHDFDFPEPAERQRMVSNAIDEAKKWNDWFEATALSPNSVISKVFYTNIKAR